MKPLIFTLAFAAGNLLAREARVETCGGQSFFGHVALRDGQILILNAAQDLRIATTVTNLLWAAFEKNTFTVLPAKDDLRAQWTGTDIGWSLAPGHVAFHPIGRVASTGTNILGTRDSLHFTHQPFRGDREIAVRLLQLPRGSPAAKAGLMIREYLTPEAKTLFIGLQRGRGGLLQARDATGQNAFEVDRNDLAAPQWLKIRRQGNTFHILKSGNGHRWTLLHEITLPMRDQVYAGFAATGLTAWPQGADNADLVTFDHLQTGTALPPNPFLPTIHLQSGSTVTGPIQSADTHQIHFQGPLPPAPLPLAPVSRIHFQWVPHRHQSHFNQNRPGLLLTTGEYIEGTFQSITNDRVTISSILFGVRSFDTHHEAMALVLKPVDPRQTHTYEIITADHSKWLATRLQIRPSEILIHDASLGPQHIPIYDLIEIRRHPFTLPVPTLSPSPLQLPPKQTVNAIHHLRLP